jgi:hypothetical protein
MERICRKKAVRLGLKRYFTGKPCPKGHISERAVKNCICCQCKDELMSIFRTTKEGKKYNASYYEKLKKENPELNQIKEEIQKWYNSDKGTEVQTEILELLRLS